MTYEANIATNAVTRATLRRMARLLWMSRLVWAIGILMPMTQAMSPSFASTTLPSAP